ncbi:MAG: hypothetical protein JW896_13730, partial [Deltaproteobacteria bacterium]|nr:hypothetical protein [Deltaproteobacteria bacterium]
LRLVGSYLHERYDLSSAGVKTSYEGSSGFPEWTGVLTGAYRRGPLRLTATARYTDEMLLNRNWNYNGTSTRWDVLDNTIDERIILNARVNYTFDLFGGFLDLFGIVNNVFDKWPEQLDAGEYSAIFGGDFGNANWGTAPNQDRRGRIYTFGVQFERDM